MTNWQRLQQDHPDLAGVVRARFAANRHHVLGTLRRNGAPRLSGTEVEIDDRGIRLGMMPDSAKLADVLRDPRVEIHSAPLEEDLAVGDVKLTGVLRHLGDVADQPGSAFELDLTSVVHVTVTGDRLRITSWGPDRGLSVIERT